MERRTAGSLELSVLGFGAWQELWEAKVTQPALALREKFELLLAAPFIFVALTFLLGLVVKTLSFVYQFF